MTLLICFTDGAACVPNNEKDCVPCGITGNWINDLGSNVQFSCHDGRITGRYNSAVGNANDYYTLSGGYTRVGPGLNDLVVGWTVAWNNEVKGNSNSTASFTGVYYNANHTIHTTWILTRYTSVEDMWMNSNVGRNVFTRVSASKTTPYWIRSSAVPLRLYYAGLLWLTAFSFVTISFKYIL